MPKPAVSIVPIGPKSCTPFTLEVMVFAPESGYKFKVIVERSCSPSADAIWKLVFDLFKVDAAGKETQVVHVSFTTTTPQQAQTVQQMVRGVKPAQADALVNKVHPAVKAIDGVPQPSPAQKKAIRDAMTTVVEV